jgi:hypothetical protein
MKKLYLLITIPEMGGGDEGEWWKGEFKYDIFDIK